MGQSFRYLPVKDSILRRATAWHEDCDRWVESSLNLQKNTPLEVFQAKRRNFDKQKIRYSGRLAVFFA
tara:strand:- start:693 stop:896 length:204 start_codon:yes stop_codon:yes gene_type:complete